jgi:manganese transport system substrate-binding protein
MKLNLNNFQMQLPQLAVASGLLLGLCLGGCSPSTSNSQPQLSQSPATTTTNREKKDKKVVLTTFTVIADMAQNVAGDKAIVESITKRGAEIHGYEPTPSDLVRAQKADLILNNGLNLERWAQKLYNSFPVSVHDVVMMGRYGYMNILRIPSAKDQKVVRESLERVQMWSMRDRQIGELAT